jgi:hypothetical protein
MLRSFHHASTFEQIRQNRSAQPTPASFWPAVTALRTMGDALREGRAAHRQYEQVRSRGIPHETAIREALGFGLTPSQETREAAKPLYLAGNA